MQVTLAECEADLSIVSRLYDLLQTGAIYQPSPMDRWLRDTLTMCQHIIAQDRILQSGPTCSARPRSFPCASGSSTSQRGRDQLSRPDAVCGWLGQNGHSSYARHRPSGANRITHRSRYSCSTGSP